uniref:S41 family peptidase n=1 Tax=Agathobacter sp. TaxID=2021311 RepID=UPI004055D934
MEIMDLNKNEEISEMRTNTEKKPNFFTRHKFGIGLLSGALAIVLVCCIAVQVISGSGYTLVIGGNGTSKVDDNILLTEETVKKIDEIYSYLNLYYYDAYEFEDIQENLYKGLMNGLDDPYSEYYTAQEYADLMVNTSGTYAGIGAALSQNVETMEVVISKVYRGTPAEEAGLMNGDYVLKVNEIDATSMELSDLVQNIRGNEGTSVHMVIYRESAKETLEFDVIRRNVELPSIEGEMIEDGIGYIQITEFQSKTAEQFAQMTEDLKNQGMKGLILDVRANPGGYLSTVVEIADRILPKGLVVYTENKYESRQEYTSDAACLDMPLVVLIDANSASASEILVGAVKDYAYGTLVGTTTFGKGIVQNVVPLSDGDAIKITTSKYFTPNGNYIHEVGIAPDVEIEYEYAGPMDEPYDKQYDNQFLKALEIMQQELKAQ